MGLLDVLSGGWTDDKDTNAAIRHGLLSAAFGAMAGRGTRMQAIGQGGLSGLASYGNTLAMQEDKRRSGLAEQMQRLQMEAMQRQRADDDAMRGAIRGSVVQPQLPPTMDNRDVGQPGEAQLLPRFDMGRYATNLAQVGSPQALQAFQAMQKQAPEMKSFDPTHDLYRGDTLVRQGSKPADKGTSDMQEFAFAQSRGEVPHGMSFTEWLRGNKKSGASNISVSASADKGFAGEIGKLLANAVQTGMDQSSAAQASNATIANIRDAVKSGGVLLGPGANARQIGMRVGQVAGVGSQEAAKTLANTKAVEQGLAQIELDAAALMKGQGQITEAERAIIKRAAAGDIGSLTPPELEVALKAIERNNAAKIKMHEQRVKQLRTNPAMGSVGGLMDVQRPPADGGVIDWGSLGR